MVKIIVTELEDKRPVEDILWPDKDYRIVYGDAGLKVIDVHRPLGQRDDLQAWVNETTVAPWVLYVLARA